MAYSELIKKFDKIRAYMRDFYVYGFKSRAEYDLKSARSYDDERRQIESWLGDHICFAIAVVLGIGLLHLFAYLETKDCLCSVLTEEEKTFPIDERLSSVIDPYTVNSGTFAVFTTFCDHRVRPDAGIYRGYLLDCSVQE